MIPLSYYLVLSAILFACGVTGFLIKRNIITIFMSIELMLNGVNLSFVAFAAKWHALSGHVFVFFVMVVAAAEAAVALGFCGAAFLMALWIAAQFSSLSLPYSEILAPWIRSGRLFIDFAFYLDQLSLVMLLVVTGVGFLIHIYSVGYMWEDGGYYRFFSYLNLFMFFMLTLVLASNYLLMFIGWEGVGLASYL